MARKIKGFGAACYYNGKLIGRCTVSDSDVYAALMKQYGNNAKRVLQEYTYFSPELKTILEKVAATQAGQTRSAKQHNKRDNCGLGR